jgi:hypothetical protein
MSEGDLTLCPPVGASAGLISQLVTGPFLGGGMGGDAFMLVKGGGSGPEARNRLKSIR